MAEDKKRKYLRLKVEVIVIEALEDIEVPALLGKYREEGSAKIIDAAIVELTDAELQTALYDTKE